MSALDLIAGARVHQLGWTLIQFLWQGAVIALLYALARAAAGGVLSSAGRYALACGTLATMIVTPIVTFVLGDAVPGAADRWLLPGATGWEPVVPWLVITWLCGVVLFTIRLSGGCWVAHRLRSRGVQAVPADWQRAFDSLVRRLRVTAGVQLLASTHVEVPTVVGWLKPLVLVPAGMLSGLPPDYVKALLAHELAHVRRADYLVNLLQRAAEALLFYHPAVWWVSEQIRLEREMCCDDIAISVHGDPLTYAHALTTLEASRRAHTAVLAANGAPLLQRIRRMVGGTTPASALLPGPGALLAIVLLWAVGITVVGAAEETQTPRLPAPPPLTRAAPAPASGASAFVATALLGPLGPPARPRGEAAPALSPVQAASTKDDATAVVSGRVVRTDTREPVLKAQVTLVAIPGGGARTSEPLSITTDREGRYTFAGLTPGQYIVWASKQGFVSSVFGQRTPADQPAPLVLRPGEKRERVEIGVAPGGVLAGRVVDTRGEPLAGVVVQALKEQFWEGRSVPGPTVGPADVTDDLGGFRLFGLPEGTYYIGAQMPDLMRSTVITRSRSLTPADRLYYPGTRRADGGQALHVGPGVEVDGLVFVAPALPGHRITGMVRRRDGSAAAARISLREESMDGGRQVRRLTSRADGSFEVVGLESGIYEITASVDAESAMASERVTLDFEDASVTLTLGPIEPRRSGPTDPTAPRGSGPTDATLEPPDASRSGRP